MVSRKNSSLFFRIYGESLKPGDLVKWTFAKTSDSYNINNMWTVGILLKSVPIPENSWQVLLSTGNIIHGCETEIEVIK